MLAGLVLALSTGCESTPNTAKRHEVFYPQPPVPPRLQLLVSLSGEQDLGREMSKFATYVVGKPIVTKPIGKPYGVALRDGKMFVCDLGTSSVDILDLKAQTFRYFTPTGEGQFITPINIAVDYDGTRYVTDTARGQILIYGADDQYIGAIGAKATKGEKPLLAANQTPPATEKDSLKPTDVLLAGNRLYVTDLKSRAVQVYDKTKRELLFTIPRNPDIADSKSKLFSPVNMAMDTHGRLYVSDIGAFRVQQFAADGRFLRSYGLGAGDKPGEFARPKGVAVDRDGRVYVVDAGSQVVQIFDQEGRLLLYFGEMLPHAPGLDLPAKVIIDYDHVGYFQKYAAPNFHVEYLVIVTNQFGDSKVSVFGFGHQN
jgi:DNA-binding beta-propeller fold protein YncE